MYLALDSVHPVTLAVGNTMKRIFIMVASVMVFRNEITTQAAIGSAIGIGGVLLYSLTKQHYENLATSSPSAASSSVLAKGSKKVNSTAKAKAAIVATNKGKKDEKKR
jgi:drug/metabolite transporter (DMT)-like permease